MKELDFQSIYDDLAVFMEQHSDGFNEKQKSSFRVSLEHALRRLVEQLRGVFVEQSTFDMHLHWAETHGHPLPYENRPDQAPTQPEPEMVCDIKCNVARWECEVCHKYASYCLTHNRPGKHNKCQCVNPHPVPASPPCKHGIFDSCPECYVEPRPDQPPPDEEGIKVGDWVEGLCDSSIHGRVEEICGDGNAAQITGHGPLVALGQIRKVPLPPEPQGCKCDHAWMREHMGYNYCPKCGKPLAAKGEGR
jgi:hypothetical protein